MRGQSSGPISPRLPSLLMSFFVRRLVLITLSASVVDLQQTRGHVSHYLHNYMFVCLCVSLCMCTIDFMKHHNWPLNIVLKKIVPFIKEIFSLSEVETNSP